VELPGKIETVLVVGAGWTGRQIAARLAQFGVKVWIRDRDAQTNAAALEWIASLPALADDGTVEDIGHGSLFSAAATNDVSGQATKSTRHSDLDPDHFVQNVRLDVTESLDGESDSNGKAADFARHIDLVIECVPEQVSIKKRTLRKLAEEFPPPTILCSNSSYFVPSLLGEFVKARTHFAHLHFHVPVLRSSVVDVSPHADTDPQVVRLLSDLVERIGHEPLVLSNEHPGYIFNWLLQSVLSAALQLRAADIASPEMIDQSWKSVTGMPIGPFGIMDQIGLDVIEQVLQNAKWSDHQAASVAQLLEIIRPLVDGGKLGTKTGAGFYSYHPPKSDPPASD